MRYENDSLCENAPNANTLFVAGMPWVSENQQVVAAQQDIMRQDGVVAVEVKYPHFAAGAVGVSVRRLNPDEMAAFAKEVPDTLSSLENQVANGGGLRYITGAGVHRTWESDLRNATTLAQQLLSRMEQRLANDGGNLSTVRTAKRQVSDVASRAAWSQTS